MIENRSKDWLQQAENDLQFAGYALSGKYFSQVCFVSQQAAEKALKALAFHRGSKAIIGHSVKKIAEELKLNSEVDKAARILDQYYITARYPDGLPAGSPHNFFSEDEARSAIEAAEIIFKRVKNEM